MANNLSNYLTVKGTDKVIDALKIKFDAAKEGSENILGFCKSFSIIRSFVLECNIVDAAIISVKRNVFCERIR